MFGWREVKGAMCHKDYVRFVEILRNHGIKFCTTSLRSMNDYMYIIHVKKKDVEFAEYVLR